MSEEIRRRIKMKKIKTPTLECLRCGHTWTPRKAIIKQCPKCKSAYYYFGFNEA
jgi:Zn finger protein HypA/HybF involved in hydrogenase expression